jgi:hypothetical protein
LTVIALEEGYHFDASLAMICNECNKPIVPTEWREEQVIDASLRTRAQSSHAWQGWDRERERQVGPQPQPTYKHGAATPIKVFPPNEDHTQQHQNPFGGGVHEYMDY